MAKKIELIENPTLEDVLVAFNGYKKEKVLLKKVQRDDDGYVKKTFTKKGGKLYENLTSLLFGIGRLTGNLDAMIDVVDDLDEIAKDE